MRNEIANGGTKMKHVSIDKIYDRALQRFNRRHCRNHRNELTAQAHQLVEYVRRIWDLKHNEAAEIALDRKAAARYAKTYHSFDRNGNDCTMTVPE